MALANTLSVLLNFKTDLSGLEKFTSTLTRRLQQVQELNSKIVNGAAAVNGALQAAAGFLAVGQLQAYTREAVEARTAQGKLAQALRQQGQDSSGYRRELEANASALQQTTGIQDELIVGVQRQLVFAKAQRADMAELTALTLDFAAAKETDVVSAAKAVGRALQGEGDELKRYGVEVSLTGDKVQALKDGLGKFKGQAATAFAALPEGMRNFQVASAEAKQSAGEAVISLSSPFLGGLADGLRTITGRLDDVTARGSAVRQIFEAVSSTLGSIVGANLDKIMLLVGGLLALKAGGYLLNQVLVTTASLFLAITGQSLPATIAGIQSLSKEVGILRALSVGGWVGGLAVGLAGLAVFAAGAVAINAIESASLARLAAENQVRQAAADQTKEFTEQLRLIRSITDARNTAAGIEAALTKAVAERDALEARKKQASGQSLFMASRIFGPAEGRRLDDLNKQVFDLAQRYRLAVDQEFVAGQIKKNGGATAVDTAKLTPEQIAARDELAERRALFELETQIREAEIDGNIELQERLIAERDLVTSLKDLGQEGYELAINRINLQAEERKKKRDEEAKDKADEKSKEAKVKAAAAAQLSAAAQERALAADLARLQREIAAVESNRFITNEEKQRRILPLLQEENDKLAARLLQLDELIAKEPDPAKRLDLLRARDDVTDRQASTQTQITEATPITPQQGALQGAVGFLDGIGTSAQNAADSVTNILNSALKGTSDILYGLATGSMSFREAWGAAVVQVGQQFAQMASDMVAKMIWKATVERALTALGLTTHVAAEGAKTSATLAGGAIRLGVAIKEGLAAVYSGAVGAFKAMASIPFVGPILGAAAMAAAVVGGISLISKIGGHEQGGVVRGGKQLTWINEAGTESVLNARATYALGEDFINLANAGNFAALADELGALPGSVAATLPAAAAASSAAPSSVLSPQSSGQQPGGFHGKIFLVMDESTLPNLLANEQGEKIVIRHAGRNRRALGMET